ncbi:MAG: hypothetical protein AAGN66_05555 [Acidobacteriota bacterium]
MNESANEASGMPVFEQIERLSRIAAGEDKGRVFKIGDREFFVDSDGDLVDVHHQLELAARAYPSPFSTSTLQSLVAYVGENRDQLDLKSHVVHVVSPTEVVLQGPLDNLSRRASFLKAKWPSLSTSVGRWQDLEAFRVEILTGFQATETREALLEALGRVKASKSQQVADDGVSQRVSMDDGVDGYWQELPSPLELVPFRTFSEVDQPSSVYVLRVRKGDSGLEARLLIADGGSWGTEAVSRIGTWLEARLAEVADADEDLSLASLPAVLY